MLFENHYELRVVKETEFPFLVCIALLSCIFVFPHLSFWIRHTYSNTVIIMACPLLTSSQCFTLSFTTPSLLVRMCVGRWGRGLMSAQAMICSEDLICCGSALQRPISIPLLTPQLPHTVRFYTSVYIYLCTPFLPPHF